MDVSTEWQSSNEILRRAEATRDPEALLACVRELHAQFVSVAQQFDDLVATYGDAVSPPDSAQLPNDI